MQTVQEVLDQALRLLGYADGCGGADSARRQALLERGLAAVNQACSDLWFMESREAFAPLETPADALPLPARCATDILPYGVAMFLAQSEGDGDNQRLYAALYNQKRAAASRRRLTRQDTMFRGGGSCGL